MWNVPADHEMFAQVNTAQWLWYFHNFMKDQEDDFAAKRDMVEYQMSFSEPEMVKNVRKTREETSAEVDNASFYKGVENLFGRSIDPSGKSQSIEGGIHDLDLDAVMRRMQEIAYREKNADPSLNYRHWSTLNLG